jgi:hypothetical protein
MWCDANREVVRDHGWRALTDVCALVLHLEVILIILGAILVWPCLFVYNVVRTDEEENTV